MDLREIQVASGKWRDRNFPDHTGEQAFMGMVEELGEIAHHRLKREQGIRGDRVDHEAEIRDGCADLIIFMMGLANNEGFDILDAVNEAWATVSQRDWIKFPGNGVDK
jgi:NTP pyrophosphatase (non-canonical NTP hydrolase)